MFRLLIVVPLLFWTALAAAQTPPAPAEAPAESPQTAAEPPSTRALIELLRDDAARQELIRQLEAGLAETAPEDGAQVGAQDGAQAADAPQEGAEAGAAAEAEPATPRADAAASFGRRIAEITQRGALGVADTFGDFVSQIRFLPNTLQALSDAADPKVVLAALADLAFVIAVTYASFVVLKMVSNRISDRLGRRATDRGWFETAALSILSSVIDIAVVALAWAAGYALTLAFYQGFGQIQIRQSLYLNAFLSVELAKVAGRAILSPRFSELRLITLSDAAAKSIWRWLNLVISILGYGLLLAVPIVNFSAGYFAGAALSMTVSAIVVIYTMVRVIRARSAVAGWLYKDGQAVVEAEQEGDETALARTPLLARLAALWHWPVMIYLAVLLVLVVARPGNVLLPLLQASGMVLATGVGGLMMTNLLARSGKHGVHLPGYMTERLPLLEHRLNGMVPRALFLLRMAVALLVVGITLDIIGLWDIRAWLGTDAGQGFISNLVTVLLITGVAFLVWVAMASWVEFRLNPLFGTVPTARETTLLTLFRNAATIAILVLTLMFTLSNLGLDIAPLLASAGVLGLAIGFGAQKMVQDIITGVFIQFENAINVGDVITVGGVTGGVEKLTVRSVSLRDVQGAYHIIPFSSVDMVTNFTRDFAYHVADIGVAYREDIDMAKQAMLDAFDELRADPEIARDIVGDMEWFGLNTFGDSAIVLRGRIKTAPGKQWGIGRAYNGIIKRIFDERGIEIPFPHQTIYFGEDRSGKAPPLHIVQDMRGDKDAPSGDQ